MIDEAQKIKNHGALVSKAVKEVGNAIGHTRIALSGTLVLLAESLVKARLHGFGPSSLTS